MTNPFHFERLDAPGTVLMYQAVFDVLRGREPGYFLEVGCGYGSLTRQMIERGWSGLAIDLEPLAVESARRFLKPELASQRLTIREADLWDLTAADLAQKPDIAYAMMVIEHIEDDRGFLARMANLVRPGGVVIVAAPGGRRFWNFEDTTVGHLRRYDREDMSSRFDQTCFRTSDAWSVGFPLCNWTFKLGDFLLRHSKQNRRATLSLEGQTRESWDINVPFKTTYPRFFRWILHQRSCLAPFCAWQRHAYQSNLGTVMLGFGEVA